MRWSVGIEAEGTGSKREQVVDLADAVAASSGIATGIGTNRYGAQLIVQPAAARKRSRRALRSSRGQWRRQGSPGARWCGSRPSARTRTGTETRTRMGTGTRTGKGAADDQARLAGRLPVRGSPPARRLDTAVGAGRVRHRLQARSGDQARPVRGHLRGPLQRPHRGALPL